MVEWNEGGRERGLLGMTHSSHLALPVGSHAAQRNVVGPPASTGCAKKTAKWEFSNVRPSLLLLLPKID
ncbi:hypothetical protein L1887_62768 [Cichorium endivia]|nr:hypothetical protein L1887_62768 [Cichorium endivia]